MYRSGKFRSVKEKRRGGSVEKCVKAEGGATQMEETGLEGIEREGAEEGGIVMLGTGWGKERVGITEGDVVDGDTVAGERFESGTESEGERVEEETEWGTEREGERDEG